MLYLPNCAIARYGVNPEIPDNNLVLISTLNIKIVAINKSNVEGMSYSFYIIPGKNEFEVVYTNGRIYSKASKSVSFEAKEGETVFVCGLTSFNRGNVDFNMNGDWLVFPVITKGFNLQNYEVGIGHDYDRIFKEYCIPEADAKNYWEQFKGQ